MTPDQWISFASNFGLPAALLVALLYFGFKYIAKPLTESHVGFVKTLAKQNEKNHDTQQEHHRILSKIHETQNRQHELQTQQIFLLKKMVEMQESFSSKLDAASCKLPASEDQRNSK